MGFLFHILSYLHTIAASLLKTLNKPQEAIIHFREAIRLAPNQLEAYEGTTARNIFCFCILVYVIVRAIHSSQQVDVVVNYHVCGFVKP